jgi:hypothetical protein
MDTLETNDTTANEWSLQPNNEENTLLTNETEEENLF